MSVADAAIGGGSTPGQNVFNLSFKLGGVKIIIIFRFIHFLTT